MEKAKVAVFIGSASDEATVAPCADILKKLGIPFRFTVTSAHRTPERTAELVDSLEAAGCEVFICAAGMAAHLAGAVAARTMKPVIGIPVAASPLGGAAATTPFGAVAKGLAPTATGPASGNDTSRPLDANQTQYLTALLASDTAARTHALSAVSTSEDMMVDTINEALFDLLGDTAIEYGPDGPQIIEDYREDVEEILA